MRPDTLTRAIYRDLRGKQTTPRSDEEHLSAAIGWLYRSQDVTEDGGSAAHYSLLTGWEDSYPETTGYIIPTLYDYADYIGSEEPRRRAEEMAEWLLNIQLSSGAFPAGIGADTSSGPSVFNTGQIIFGLIRTYHETGNVAYLDAAKRSGDWLTDVQHENGYWDQFDYRDEVHSYCSRVAWALLEIYPITNNDIFYRSAVRHLEWVSSRQTDTDWFKNAGFSPNEAPPLHTIAYTVRGLLESGIQLNNDEFVSTAKATADQLLECHQHQGPLKGVYDQAWRGKNFHCLTGNAQVVLIWQRLYEWLNDEQYLNAARNEISFIKRNHTIDDTVNIQGGIKGSHPIWGEYMRLRYPNWSVKFFVDCLINNINMTNTQNRN
jgi:uncharacterized protein YyaL (SSP411 family)